MKKQKIVFKHNQETELPQEIIDDAPTQGPFDDYAECLLAKYEIEVSLEDSVNYLEDFGAWDAEDLENLELNKTRILWLSCLRCKEEKTNFFYMGI